MPASPATGAELTGKLKEIHDALPEGERQDFLDALSSPSMPAERLAYAIEQMDVGVSTSASLIRTFRREYRLRKATHD